jgi:hypothetical protein
MYNFNIKINYKNEEDDKKNIEYQNQLLSAFNVNNQNISKINEIQCKLYEIYKENECLRDILIYFKNNQKIIPLELSLKTCFVFLFSYDFFEQFHLCLQDINSKCIVSEKNKKKIYFLIKK